MERWVNLVDQKPQIQYFHQPMMLITLLLATWLRLGWLEKQSIAFDESFSLVVALSDWSVMFQALLSDGVHPPLFYILHKWALALWGISEFGQRFLPAVFSILIVALGYRLGRTIFNKNSGLLAAVLLALNPLQIWLSQEARMYSLLSFLTMVSMFFFWKAIQGKQVRYWIGLTFANALIFGIHYFGFLIPTIQFVFLMFTFSYNYRHLRAWTLVQFVAVLPLLPWLVYTAYRESQTFGIGFLVQPTLFDFFITLWNLALGSSYLFWPVSLVAIGVIVATILFTWRSLRPHKIQLRHGRLLATFWFMLPLLITWLASQRRSFYADRYLSFAIPGLALLLAFGATRITSPRWRVLLSGGLILSTGWGLAVTRLDPTFLKDDWRSAVTHIHQSEQRGDVILLYTTHIKFVFDYYYSGDIPLQPISLNENQFPIEPLTEGHNRSWVIYPYTRRPTHYPMQPLKPDGFWTEDPDRNPELVDWLRTNANNIIATEHFRGVQVWLVDLADGAQTGDRF